MGTLKPQSSGLVYNNTVIGTLAVGGSWVGYYIWYSEEGTGRDAAPPSAVLATAKTTKRYHNVLPAKDQQTRTHNGCHSKNAGQISS